MTPEEEEAMAVPRAYDSDDYHSISDENAEPDEVYEDYEFDAEAYGEAYDENDVVFADWHARQQLPGYVIRNPIREDPL